MMAGAIAIAALVSVAAWLVYGAGASAPAVFQGRVLLAALAGGWALGFTRPFVLVLLPFASVIGLRSPHAPGARPPQGAWLAPAAFLAGFALAFSVAISGAPDALARAIYAAHGATERVLAALVALWGALIAVRVPAAIAAQPGPWAAGLGTVTGLVFYHELDPSYDSVFFATGNAVAASHAPLTVGVFATALAGLYLAVALVAHRLLAPVVIAAGRAVAGAGTAVVGAAIAAGWWDLLRPLISR